MATVLDLNLVETYNISTIGFADISVYSSNPTNTSFEISIPGYGKKNVQFVPRVVNIFNALSLDLDCNDDNFPLPDGIYHIKYSVSPNETTFVEKSFMRTSSIKCKYMNKFLAIDVDCNCNGEWKSKQKRKLYAIKMLIEGSIAAANQCDSVTAYDMYRKADSLLDKISTCGC